MIYINQDFFNKNAYKMGNTRAILKNLLLFCKVFNKVSKKNIFFRFLLKLGIQFVLKNYILKFL